MIDMEVREMTIEEIKALLNKKDTEIALLTKNLTSTRDKLATAVEALENIKIAAKSLDDEAEYNYASEALAEIGGDDD